MIKSKSAGQWRKTFLGIIAGAATLGMQAVCAEDYGLNKTAGSIGYSTSGSQSDIYGIVGIVVTTFLGLLGFVFFGLMLYSGLRWMLARGQAEYVQKAKDNIISSIIGLTIVLAAYAITRFVLLRLGQ